MNVPTVDLSIHHKAEGLSDLIALGFTKTLRWCADTFFAKRYGHRAIVLETVAAVPGMVGATITHLRCLRRMCDDRGWIRTLMEEAENERMHLMTFIEVAKPTVFERFVVMAVQWVFYLGFFGLYLLSPRTAHRLVGYFEEEAVISYTHYLNEIDEGAQDGTSAGRLFRGGGGHLLYPLSQRDRRGPLSQWSSAGYRAALLEVSSGRDPAGCCPAGAGG
jgi:ubiquinol oxidase